MEINDFMNMTNASEDIAYKWLEIGGFDLSTSVELYLSSFTVTESNENAQLQKILNNTETYSNSDSYNDTDYVRQPDKIKRQVLLEDSNYFYAKSKIKLFYTIYYIFQ
jgi:hypothetical protein